MDEFADVAKARASYQVFFQALMAGREIMKRAGVAEPPPVPEFDFVFRRLDAAGRRDLYATLRNAEEITPRDALQIWQPLVKRALAG